MIKSHRLIDLLINW